MKYADDLFRHIEDEYDHIHFLDMEDDVKTDIIECWRDHDSESDRYYHVSDEGLLEIPAAVLSIQSWLIDAYENYLEGA